MAEGRAPHPFDSGATVEAGDASLIPRLLAAIYDSLVLAAAWMGAGFAALLVTGGEAVPPGTPWFRALLVGVALAYFGLSWRLGGQTIGGRAWRLRVVDLRGEPPAWPAIATRLAVAVLSFAVIGLGWLWALVDPARRTWHDRASATRVLRLPKGQPVRRK